MGTEVRIGVLTGLLIVIVAGVYFFYGRNRDKQDLEIVTGKTPVVVPTIPSGRDVQPAKSSAKPTPMASAASRTTAPNRNPQPLTTPNSATPGGGAFRQPMASPTPGTNSPMATNTQTPAGSVRTPITPSTGTARPASPSTSAGHSTVASTPPPAENSTTLLRTSPSSALREATQSNLEAAGVKPASTANATTPSAEPKSNLPNTGTIRLPDSLSPTGPKPSPTASTHATGQPLPTGSSSTPKPTASPSTLAMNAPRSTDPSATGARPAPRPEDMKPTPLARPITNSPPAAASARPAPVWPQSHVIVSGETLSVISEKYYDTTQQVDRIMKANPSLNPRRLKIGDVVTIPAPDAELASDANVAKTHPAVKPQTPAAPLSADAAPTPGAARTYTIRSGDTLYSIATKMLGDGKKWKQLFEKNRALLKNDPKRLKIGMVLTLP